MTAVAVHHVSDGRPDGPTVVLAGALGSTLTLWERQVAALGEHFRVLRYDFRGHGGSPVPSGPYSIDDFVDDAVALLDRVGVPRAHFVGLSLGGMVGVRLAAREPDRVDRLVLMCTSALMAPAQPWADRAAVVRAEGTGAVAATVVSRWLTPQRQATHPEEVEELVAMVAATSAEGYASSCTAIERMDLRADLPTIAANTLVLSAAEDPSIPPVHQQAIAATIPGARLHTIRHAAHLVSFERADVVNPLLVEHLAG